MRSQFIKLAVEISIGFAIASFQNLIPQAVLDLWILQARKAIKQSEELKGV